MTVRRKPLPLDPIDYPVEPWRLVERRFDEELLPRIETLFTVSNGYVGLRGNHEEGRPAHEHSTLIAGFHETWPIQHAEQAFGLAKTGQTIIDVPDAKIIKLYVDDEPLFLPTAVVHGYERALDFRSGTLDRSMVWETPSGRRVEIRSRRLVSLPHRHLVALQFDVCVLNADASLIISSQLVNRQDAAAPEDERVPDPRVRTLEGRVLHNHIRSAQGTRLLLGYRTSESGMSLGCGADHLMRTECDYQVMSECQDDLAKVTYTVDAKLGVPIQLTKFAAYHSSRGVAPRELVDRAERVLSRATAAGFDQIASQQRESLDLFWEASDVEVEGDDAVQQAVRWNLFQLHQATARAEGSGVPAKGLSGHGYEGHYFWDIEIFVLPFLCYTDPRIAKNLLRFRHSMLDAARARARELNEDGALFPWRTISGDEASAYYQAGTAQYHLNADIAYALKRYVDVSGDVEALSEFGAELLVETARMWTGLGFFDQHERFHLYTVTGPDEYTTVVNDNAFTNLMARLNLNYAATVLDELRERDPQCRRGLASDIALRDDEPLTWRRIADSMHVPFDAERCINPQDAQFLEREAWNFEGTPAENYPLLLHYHPLVIYRHQVLKQADVVLAMFLLGNEFDLEQKRRNFDYYDPLTTSDSSLSPPVHSIVAAEILNDVRAMEHFRLTLLTDLADVASNSEHGVHVAATGGTWMALVYGFGGLRDFDGRIQFDPRLPKDWKRLGFSLRIRDTRLRVDLTHETMTLRLSEGTSLEVEVFGQEHKVTDSLLTVQIGGSGD